MAASHDITRKQADILQGFFLHVWGVIHEGAKKDFGYYSTILDEAKISWAIQNSVAGLADERNSIHSYFRTLLASKKIIIKEAN